MATTNITMRMDADIKAQLQELMSDLGMDMTTFLRWRQSRQSESKGFRLKYQGKFQIRKR